MTRDGEKCIYSFDGDEIKRNGTGKVKRNYFERLYDRERALSSGMHPAQAVQKFRQRQRLRCIIFRIFLFTFVTFIMGLLIISSFFRINETSVEGSRKYDNEKIALDTAFVGKNLLFLDERELIAKLREQYPYLDEIKIEKKLPCGVVLHLTDAEPEYYISYGGDDYILSKELCVLERAEGSEDISELIEIRSGRVNSCEVGKTLGFDNEYSLEYVRSASDKLSEHKISSGVTAFDVKDDGEIVLTYDDRLTIMLGGDDEMETKMTLACAYIQTIDTNECGIIYAQNTKTGSFLPTEDVLR